MKPLLRTIKVLTAAALLTAHAGTLLADDSTSLTIYSKARPGAVSPELYRPLPGTSYNASYWLGQIPGYAVVRQDRDMDIPKGTGSINFTDVASLIDPTTVRFTSLTDPDGTLVYEQDYRFDLIGSQKLMEKYIDRQITIEQIVGDSIDQYTGTLLSTNGGLVLKTDQGIRVMRSYTNVIFPELPGGLMTRPTLVWQTYSKTGGSQTARVSYETKGITWWTDYNLTWKEGDNPNKGTLDLGAWVSIINKSGASYHDAKLKLIAGDVNRAPQGGRSRLLRNRNDFSKMEMMADAAPAGFAEKSFFEFHLYTLGRATTIPDNSTKQIELFDQARDVPADKLMVYVGQPYHGWSYSSDPFVQRDFGNQSNKKIDVYLRFKNDEDFGLGVPLPAGRIRVSQLDEADGSLEFIGEDIIDHTPKNESVLIKLGSAFDVVGEHVRTNFLIDARRKTMSESFKITLRNHKDKAVTVIVKESLFRWSNWKIAVNSHEFEKINSRTIHFPVTIEPDGEQVITYTVHYSW